MDQSNEMLAINTSKRQYFGTDGIRGKVGEALINPEFVLKLGWAIGRVLSGMNGGRSGGKILIGKDTRISGYIFESVLEAGLSAAGVDAYLLGPMPTPAIAYLARTLRARAGVVISASHNDYQYNGIKVFSTEGTKLSDEAELAIEMQLQKPMQMIASNLLGKVRRVNDAPGRYIEFCKGTLGLSNSLSGLKIVVDCANGATYHIAPAVFRELGAEVIELNVYPNGFNINENCGSTCPQVLSKVVVAEQANLGIAFDGDGDRVIMVDHKGEIVDGDELLFIMAKRNLRKNELPGGIVGTLMSNFGLEHALNKLGIEFKRAKVGDRYVLEALKENGWLLGGETSGHIVNLGITTTGDGIVSALQVLAAIYESGKSLHELKIEMSKFPQVLLNVTVADNDFAVNKYEVVKNAIKDIEKKLGKLGRVLIRKSGTEPVVRVMVEGEDPTLVNNMAQELADLVKTSC